MNSIIFVHRGNSYYLPLAISQAKKSNPSLPIILLGDESNVGIRDAEHHNIYHYFNRAKDLDRVFENHSTNPRSYELFCFQRWLVISEFINAHPQYKDAFLYCDTDTQLYVSVNQILHKFTIGGGKKLGLVNYVSPGFTFFSISGLEEFCSMIEWFYKTDEGKQMILKCLDELKSVGAKDGFSDMIAIRHYCRQNVGGVWNIGTPFAGYGFSENVCFDENINSSQNGMFEMNGGIKNMKWNDGNPYVYSLDLKQNVRFLGVHFQGDAKRLLFKLRNVRKPFLSDAWKMYYIIYPLKWIKKELKKWEILK